MNCKLLLIILVVLGTCACDFKGKKKSTTFCAGTRTEHVMCCANDGYKGFAFRLEPGECIKVVEAHCEVVTATVESVVTTTVVIGEKQ